jgi:DNA polymerase-1
VVPTDRDIYAVRSYTDDALLQPAPRAQFQKLLKQGWRDALNALHPDAALYTYWSYLRNRWPRDAGLRIDHLLLSALAAKRLAAAGVDREVRGEAGASDHAPVWLELKEAGGRRDWRNRGSHPPAARHRVESSSAAHDKSDARRNRRQSLAAALSHRAAARVAGRLGYARSGDRHRAFPAYQSGRDFDDELVEQLELIPKFVAACGFANARRAGYEADDFLATAAVAEERRGGTALVASGDRDTFQLASEKTTILYPVKAGEMARIGPNEVRERYGVAPKQVPDFIALRGDLSDRLPGAPGIGAQGAAALIRQYGSLAALLRAGRFPKQAEDLKLYRSIAAMDKKAPLPKIAAQTPTWQKAAALARKWQLNQLAGRIEEMASKPLPPGERSPKT